MFSRMVWVIPLHQEFGSLKGHRSVSIYYNHIQYPCFGYSHRPSTKSMAKTITPNRLKNSSISGTNTCCRFLQECCPLSHSDKLLYFVYIFKFTILFSLLTLSPSLYTYMQLLLLLHLHGFCLLQAQALIQAWELEGSAQYFSCS